MGLSAAPAAAQRTSDSFAFLQAVESGDGAKATDLLNKPGSTVVNARSLETGESGLHIAARRGQPSWILFLLGKGARPDVQDDQGNSPLFVAAQRGLIEGAEALLKRGANVNLANAAGETPLIAAVHRRDLAMVKLLMANGGDPHRTDNAAGLSALDYARRDSRMPALIEALEKPQPPKRAIAGPTL